MGNPLKFYTLPSTLHSHVFLCVCFFFQFYHLRYKTICSSLYLKWALWFLLILRLTNFFKVGRRVHGKELSLIENLYV